MIRRRLDSLQPIENVVFKHLIAGESNKQIALRLDIGLRTVEGRRRSILKKMQAESMAELVQLVMLIDPTSLPPPPEDDG